MKIRISIYINQKDFKFIPIDNDRITVIIINVTPMGSGFEESINIIVVIIEIMINIHFIQKIVYFKILILEIKEIGSFFLSFKM